jgi:hypothetical protein
MTFTQQGTPISVNMNRVTHITPNNPQKPEDSLSALYFGLGNDYASYIIVDQSYDEIASRSEWRNV